ncbi:MAG: hypothetical protein ACLQE9_05820, partial [Roseiarcus sp.]
HRVAPPSTPMNPNGASVIWRLQVLGERKRPQPAFGVSPWRLIPWHSQSDISSAKASRSIPAQA